MDKSESFEKAKKAMGRFATRDLVACNLSEELLRRGVDPNDGLIM